MKNFNSFLAVLGMALLIGFASCTQQTPQQTSQQSTDQKPRVERKVQSRPVTQSRGAANPNIKSEAPATDTPEAKSRGAACVVGFDNWTGLYIHLYVDGYFRGTLAPWSEAVVSVGNGYTEIYAISSGGTLEWEADGNCEDEFVYFALEE